MCEQYEEYETNQTDLDKSGIGMFSNVCQTDIQFYIWKMTYKYDIRNNDPPCIST